MIRLNQIGPLCGWIDVPERHALARAFQPFASAAPRLMAASAPGTDILLYKALKDACGGAYPDYPAQTIGDCVGQGHGHANDLLQAVEIGMGEEDQVFAPTCTEFIYATSREVAGILGRNDGSYGSAAVKAMTTIGMISRAMLASLNESLWQLNFSLMPGAEKPPRSLNDYSGERARRWGLEGATAPLKALAADFKLGVAAAVRTWDELIASLANGYPVTICSNQGFTLKRDAQGFCRPQGTWGHCMMIGGVRFDRPGACIFQSWGSETPTGPTALDQPTYSFWADRGVVERILAQGDSWSIGKTPAFERRVLPPKWTYAGLA